jgi:ring-1,2-phenylacetyl-CoA epoxidase subunit PaaC
MEQLHFHYLVRLGDDSLILAQRISEWAGKAPSVEVDLSISNIALDLVGQATHFLDYAGKVEGQGRDGDKLAFHRDVLDFENCLLVEQPNADFAQTMVRQFLFSTWQKMLFDRLTLSKDDMIAAIAAKAVKEVAYHAELSAEWLIRLGDGTNESNARTQAGLEWHWRFVEELFACDAVDEAMIAARIGVDPKDFRADYGSRITEVFAQATLSQPEARRSITGGRSGHHSEHLGHILSEMQFLPRAYPDAKW